MLDIRKNKMENTNKKRYWFRGGIKSASMVIFIYLVSVLVSNLIPASWPYAALMLALIALPTLLPAFLLDYLFHIQLKFPESLRGSDFEYGTVLVVSITCWFAVGAFVGWIYGKFKNRKSVTRPSNV